MPEGSSSHEDFDLRTIDHFLRELISGLKGEVDLMYYGALDEMSEEERNEFIGNLKNNTDKLYNVLSENIVINAHDKLLKLHSELETTQRELIFNMSAVIEMRSKETGNHVKRVSEYCRVMAELYGLPAEEVELIGQAAITHDIGKVVVPDNILHKPGPLTSQEREVMKGHTTAGFEILGKSKRRLLKTAAVIAKEHHERYDGNGYPDGVKGNKIHLYGRIMSAADVFDALISRRVYKSAWSPERVKEHFEGQRARQFDPDIAEIVIKNIDTFVDINKQYLDESTEGTICTMF